MGFGKYFSRACSAVSNGLGLYELPDGNKRFLATHLFFTLFTTIPGVFINTFFFRQDGRFSTVALYNAISCFGSAMVMQFTSYISIKKTPTFVLRIGVVLFNVFYLALLLLQSRAAVYMPLLGVLNAIASGFYWQGYNVLLQSFTHDAILNRTLSILGICGAVVSLTVPYLSGLLISNFPGSPGYSVIFVLSFIFSVYTTWLSTRIPGVKANPVHNLGLTYRRIFQTKSWRTMFLAEFFRGMRDTAFPLFLSIVLFKFIENESFLGLNTMFCGLASIISFYIFGRIVRQENRIKFVLGASGILFAVFLLLFVRIDAGIIFILSIVNALLVTYVSNPMVASLFGMFANLDEKTNFAQVMAAHEIFFAAGRVVGLLFVIALSVTTRQYAYGFLLLNLTAFISAYLLHLAHKATRAEATGKP